MDKNNIFRIFGIERTEKPQSKFLAWIFDNDDWNKDIEISPIVKLLKICLERAKKQGNKEFSERNKRGDNLEDLLNQGSLIYSYNLSRFI